MPNREPYSIVKDNLGDVAKVFYKQDKNHIIEFCDSAGVKFYTEVFDNADIDMVEQFAIDWAKGNTKLVGV